MHMSLINLDAKKTSKDLALTMKMAISNIKIMIKPLIGESVQVTADILYHVEPQKLDGILFVVDMEKAYDLV